MGRIAASVFGLLLFTSGCAADGAGSGGGGIVASQKLESAVIVEVGYKLNVLRQEFEYQYENWTLFVDGTIYSRLPRAALDEFDLEASRNAEPQAWGKWRLEGDALVVTWSGLSQTKSYPKWFRLEVLPADAKLEGQYSILDNSKSLGADSGKFFATGWQVVGFDKTGRFERVKGGSVDSHQRDTETVTRQEEDEVGMYRINGSLLELSFKSGRVERASLFLSSKNAKTIFINGVQLIRR